MFFKDGGDATMTFDFHIMGGTLASTLAGEYSFMIALALSLFFLGTLARALDRRGPMWLPAVLLALTVMSHLVVAIFAVLARASCIWLLRRPVRNFTRARRHRRGGRPAHRVLAPAARGEPRQHDRHALRAHRQLPRLDVPVRELVPLPARGGRARGGDLVPPPGHARLAALTVATGLVFYNWEGLRSILGKAPAWNLRLLPFWYLMLFLLAALGVAELVRLTALGVAWVVKGSDRRPTGSRARARGRCPSSTPTSSRRPHPRTRRSNVVACRATRCG